MLLCYNFFIKKLNFTPENKKKIIHCCIFLAVFCALILAAYLLLKHFDLLNIERLQTKISEFGIWSWLVFLIVQIFCTVVLCFIPGTSMTFTLLGTALFGSSIKSYLIIFSGIFISSVIMYFLGRWGGPKVVAKLVGKEDTEKASKLIKERGTIYFPVFMVLPVFPDDALCAIAGVIKMNIPFYSLSIIIGRGIGCAFMVFGVSLIPFESFTTIYDWIIFATVVVVWIAALFYILHKIEKKINKRS